MNPNKIIIEYKIKGIIEFYFKDLKSGENACDKANMSILELLQFFPSNFKNHHVETNIKN
jgi:hypothetical protein